MASSPLDTPDSDFPSSSSISDYGENTEVTFTPDTLTTSSLRALHSADQRKVLDIVDNLRRAGLNSLLQLPQVVVIGDQSSGKSSVLEALTEIPFPRKENLCTRFATEIVLRRSPTSSICVTITPDKLRSDPEQCSLSQFSYALHDFSELPDAIDKATQEMGLGNVGVSGSRAFSRDVLSVEITGPDRPQLTLVDLPGLIHSTSKAQTEDDKALILDLAQEYMSNPRTIILAVVSAKNDFANQVILDRCRKVDPQGQRTLGIITKPDYLKEGSDNELSWIELAENKNIYLERGWHMLKNREADQTHFTFEQRNESERDFFRKCRYRDLPREHVGIESLRKRLSDVLLEHLIKEVPALKDELDLKLGNTSDDIRKLGEQRGTLKEQEIFLMRISMRAHEIIGSAVRGHYESPFFRQIQIDAPVDSAENLRRLRATIQHLNIKFAQDMRSSGQKYSFDAAQTDSTKQGKQADHDEGMHDATDVYTCSSGSRRLSPKEAIQWVKQILERSRGHELPGTFQPELISHLFWEQSQPWERVATAHMTRVAQTCKAFVHEVLEDIAPLELHERLFRLVDAVLSKSLVEAKGELKKLLGDEARQPSTYNHYFTTTIQKQRQDKFIKAHDSAVASSKEEVCVQSVGYRTYINPKKLDQAMTDRYELDMDNFACQDALNGQRAYYKDALKYFVNAVTRVVIERHLVAPLPEIILSPVIVSQMSEQEIRAIAAEDTGVVRERERLQAREALLQRGMDMFEEVMGGFTLGRKSF